MKTLIPFLVGLALIITGCSQGIQPQPVSTPVPLVIKTCTLEGCGATLKVELQGAVPSDFTVEITTAAGERAQAHCVGGLNPDATPGAIPVYQPLCGENELLFFGYSPEELDLTLRWGESTLTRHLQTAVETVYPNGMECSWACEVRKATFEFDE